MTLYKAIIFLLPFQVYAMEISERKINFQGHQQAEKSESSASGKSKMEEEKSDWDRAVVIDGQDEADSDDEQENSKISTKNEKSSFSYIEQKIFFGYVSNNPKCIDCVSWFCDGKQRELAMIVLAWIAKEIGESKPNSEE